jgi:hypothetical protein
VVALFFAIQHLLILKFLIAGLRMEPATGVEPVTSPLPRKCSNQLSYVGLYSSTISCIVDEIKAKHNREMHKILELATGFEPATC